MTNYRGRLRTATRYDDLRQRTTESGKVPQLSEATFIKTVTNRSVRRGNMGLARNPFSSTNIPQGLIPQGAASEGSTAGSGQEPAGGIPLRKFGRHEVKVSALGFGGHHLGDAPDEGTAVRLVRQAVDGGITFFDNCWEYHLGKAEDWMGAGLKGVRDRVFLMTKGCTHGRDKALALRMLDESLHRLRTDHLDLWQIHGVCFENDPALFIRKNGAAEALEHATKEGN